jgi:F-type H+-transporting ATPase subunit b
VNWLSPVSRRRFALRLALCAGLLFVALPAHSQQNQQEAQETAELDRLGPWKLINTALFAALLGWFIAKKAPAFFQARSADIQKAIQDATGLKLEADYRYSEADRKMANLAAEVQKIRDQGRAEMEREHARIQRETQTEIERIRHNADNEVEALRKEAAQRVEYHTAQRAIERAERRLSDRFAQGEPSGLIDDFIRLVERGKN